MSDHVRVLVAEDQTLIALLIESALVDIGLDVTVVSSGVEALTELADGRGFDVLVTDIRMEPGPDGWEIAGFGRARNSALHVLYITGDSMADWRLKGVADSVLLGKPFVPDDLVATVRRLIGEPAQVV